MRETELVQPPGNVADMKLNPETGLQFKAQLIQGQVSVAEHTLCQPVLDRRKLAVPITYKIFRTFSGDGGFFQTD